MSFTLADEFSKEEEPREVSRASSLSDVFAEEPVPLTVFIQDAAFLGNPPLSPVQYDAVRHIERVYYAGLYPLMAIEMDPYWGEVTRMVNLITLQWGKGSGKDHICRMASMRIAYLLLCLKSPQRYYGLPAQDTIHMLNIASSSSQAESAFFRPMVRAINASPWFEDKADPKQGFIAYAKNIEAISGHSDSESQEGGNLILGVADEIDAFRSKEELERYRGKAMRDSPRAAESILKMMQTSSSTRFPDTYKNVRISYPRYKGSTIQKLTQRARESNKRDPETSRHYVSGPLATWEVNPRVTGPEVFEEDYLEDPAMAQAMYECRPTRASDSFFRNMPAFRAALSHDEEPIKISYSRAKVRSDITGAPVEVWVPSFTFEPWFKPIEGAVYAMHADLAIKGDAAGVAMSHVMRYEDVTQTVTNEEGEPEVREVRMPFIRNDFTIAFESSMKEDPPREIQISWARLLWEELVKRGFRVVRFTFDGFQSTDSMQILETHGVESKRVSADLNQDPYKNLRDVTYEGRFELPFNAKLFEELEALSRIGAKIDHPPGGSKDLADALACSVVGAIVIGGSEDEDGIEAEFGGVDFQTGDAFANDPYGTSTLAFRMLEPETW